MILRKVKIDGKEVFEKISFEDALNFKDKEDLVFTNEDEEDEFLDRLEELEEKAQEAIESERDEDETDIDFDIDLDFGNKTHRTRHSRRKNSGFNFNFNDIGDMINNLFSKTKRNSKSSRLIATLPFLDDEAIHDIVEGILADSDEYKDLNLIAVMPFLSKEDCDKLFMKFIIDNQENYRKYIYGAVPFVSSDCLTKFTDEYINGKYQDINVNALYPFMKSEDVKRIFKYFMAKKEE